MFDDLKGKAVLVTGSSTGIGAAAARAFGAEGARVAVHFHRSEKEAAAVAGDIRKAGGEAVIVGGDVSKSAGAEAVVKGAAEALGGLDILVNNAGSMIRRAALTESDDAFFDAMIDLNVRSVVAACRAAVPIFLAAGRGNIINVGSIAARLGGSPRSSLYAASKGFVSTFTKALALEYAAHGIRVNAVAPGTVATPFQYTVYTEAQLADVAKTIPLGRVGRAEDIAGAFLYLASDAASGWVTGQILEVNGGRLMP